MKKYFVTLVMAMLSLVAVNAMSLSSIRTNARFLSDRMAYELDMTPQQYDDCYEINYDFIRAIEPYMNDVVRGYRDAIDRYYTYLDWRNDDLRYIMTERQYRLFLQLDYFYRPVYTYRNDWLLRVYQVYNNNKFFYFDMPTGFRAYNGAHSRTHYQSGFYGQNKRYNHQTYGQHHAISGSKDIDAHARNDFGHNRMDRGQTRPNNYGNSNQKDREKDHRYNNQDHRDNKNTPKINQRAQQPVVIQGRR